MTAIETAVRSDQRGQEAGTPVAVGPVAVGHNGSGTAKPTSEPHVLRYDT
jgi:hypothetical protein